MAEPTEQPQDKQPRHSLSDRLERGRQTFQPGLWSRLIAIGIVIVYLLLFVVFNTRRVRIDFVVYSTRVSLIWVILLSLAAGVVLGVLLSQLARHRRRNR
jgi:uncharacterized integral membrane protein